METRQNIFKQRLLAGETLIGIWSTLCNAVASEALADCGFDWMLIDTEHSPIEVSQVMPLLQAAATGGAASLVRPAWNDKILIKRLLDIGAQTILVPFVENAEEAQAAVSATRYPPHGIRGVAGTTRSGRYGMAADYFQRANDEVCVLVQIETAAALANLEAIASVEGVDGVFIGPADLAASLGYLGNPGHEVVQEALKDAVQRLTNIGKPAGILAANADTAKTYVAMGFQFVAAGLDLGLLVKAANNLSAAMTSE